MQSNLDNDIIFTVVINNEEQYSIWPSFRIIPQGWKEIGFTGDKQQCLAHIKEIWTDMRPLSLRKQIAQWEQEKKTIIKDEKQHEQSTSTISSTVLFLSNGSHPISLYPTTKTATSLQNCLERNFVHVYFTDTQGGTCLGIPIDPEKTKCNGVDYDKAQGNICFEGTLILDYVRIKCICNIDVSNLSGVGQVEIIEHISPYQLAQERIG